LKISREVKTAILVISGIVLFYYLFNYLKGENLFDTSSTYYVDFDYNALSKSSPVTIRGNTVGKIKDITYNYETGKTRVAFSVNEELKFSKESKIRLYETGLMGGNALSIIMAKKGELAQPGDVLQSEVEEGLVRSLTKNFSGISTNLDTTLKSADSLLINLNAMIKDDSDKGIKNAIAELNATITSFKNLSYNFNSLISKNDDELTSVIKNFDSISKGLAVLTADLQTVKLSETITKLDQTLLSINSVLVTIENGEGSIGKLLKDEGLYKNLEGATKEMEELLRDIKLHPKRYFRILSKKEIPYSDNEEIKQ
jgi:phospholipid/cholesterol/gamma-HCH transport system substrate-binding protein